MKNEVVEMVVFSSKEGVSESNLIEKSKLINSVLSQQNGFIKRTFCQRDDGKWVDIVYWGDLDSAKKAAEYVMSDDVCLEFFSLIDQSDMDFRHLSIFDEC